MAELLNTHGLRRGLYSYAGLRLSYPTVPFPPIRRSPTLHLTRGPPYAPTVRERDDGKFSRVRCVQNIGARRRRHSRGRPPYGTGGPSHARLGVNE